MEANGIRQRIRDNRNMLIPYYLMLSYLYYVKNESLIDDTEFDIMCKDILNEWDDLTHWHKPLLKKANLEAGTGYDTKYPHRVGSAAELLLKEYQG